MSKKEELMKQEENTAVADKSFDVPMGFEDEQDGDMIIPRVKIIQTLSPERKDKLAEEGEIINSLTLEKYNNKKFIPVFKFNNNIWWKPRAEGGGIQCIARDGKSGQMSDGKQLICSVCRKNEFDNSKQGADAIPKCTKYINYFGFFEGESIPVILSFSRTNYNEGKRLFSLAKVTMQNMWNFGYKLKSKLMKKGNNEWYVIDFEQAGPTTTEERDYAVNMYKTFRDMNAIKFDVDEGSTADISASVDTDNTEY